ncbi:MAG: dihydroorotase [Candidatus Aminicenantia bacterium]
MGDRILLKNGRVVDPSSNLDATMDILIENGKIKEIKEKIDLKNLEIIDCSGLIVTPGFIDLHTHLREPGREDEETIESGSFSAVAGGFTTICCMPNTEPPNDCKEVTEFIMRRAKEVGLANIFPIAAVTKGRKGEELVEMAELSNSGVVGFSEDGNAVRNSYIMRRAMEWAKFLGRPIMEHALDEELSSDGVINEGFYSYLHGLRGIPKEAEEIIVSRDLILSKLTGAHIHILHVSSGGSLELIKRAKKEGVRVTAEVTPHHLILSDKDLIPWDTNYKMNPPLRSEEDRKALIDGIKDGTIDCIATDHAPHTLDEKMVEFDQAPFGIIGLETALPLIMDKFVSTGIISVSKFVALFSCNPAKILGLKKKGSLRPDFDADITVINPTKIKVVDKNKFKSLSKNTPFQGKKLRGSQVMTIVGGKIVWRED